MLWMGCILSWIFIISGFVTRYIGYEGMMPIREELRKISSIQTKLSLLFFVDGDYKVDELGRKSFENAAITGSIAFLSLINLPIPLLK
jgi:hypothetical protein